MLGIPTQVSIGQNAPISMTNPYYGVFFQDTWRAASNLTLNFGLRYEYEGGIKEADDRWLTEFDPSAPPRHHRHGPGGVCPQPDSAGSGE